MNKILHTKWGKATLNNNGYYRIAQLMRDKDHKSLHNVGENHPMYGKHHLDESKQKISKTMNSSGYFRVCKKKDKRYNQGFIWVYKYPENGKRNSIYSVSLEKLEKRVKSKGLIWKKLDKGE